MIILLADDERLVRLSIKSMIEELEPNTHTFIEAKNGKQLINIFNETIPDLAFVDINMPLMDGLSAIEECRNTYSHTQWFVLTGEKEFYLAKKAISLGVKDYMLKPISLDDLRPIISNTKTNIKDYAVDENRKFELSFVDQFNSFSLDKSYRQSNIPFKYEDCSLYLFTVDGLSSFDNQDDTIKTILGSIRDVLSDKLDNNLKFTTYCFSNDKIAVVIKNKNLINFKSLLASFNSSYNVSLVCYSTYNSELYFTKGLSNLLKYSSLRSILNFKDITHIDKYLGKDYDNHLQFSDDILNLTLSYINKEELIYKQYIDKISNSSHYKLIYNELDKTSLSTFLKTNIKFDLNINEDFTKFINQLSRHFMSLYNKQGNDTLVSEITNYIKLNYMNDIGVNTIANLYNITPNYLSKIFHEKSGMKFIDYITFVRINESKKLLTSSYSIKEISSKVGYNSPRHFSKQFLKLEGVTPSEFLKSKSN